MSKEEIKEYNKLCAQFLGFKCSINEQYELPNMMIFPPAKNSNHCREAKICCVEDMQFHKDWNWIIEVTDAIESKGYDVFINGLYCRITDSGMSDFEIESGGVKTKKEAVVEAIYLFLKFYFKNNNE